MLLSQPATALKALEIEVWYGDGGTERRGEIACQGGPVVSMRGGEVVLQ